MAFDTSKLTYLGGGYNGTAHYIYESDTDDREDVAAVGYFNNTDDDQNLTVGDIIHVQGSEGAYDLTVASISSGAVTTGWLGGPAVYLSVQITSIAAATSVWVVSPVAGKIRRMWSVIHGAANADTTLGLELGGTNVTDGGAAAIITITASGSAAGDVDSGEADTANTVTANQAIEVTCGGEGTTASLATVMIEILPTT